MTTYYKLGAFAQMLGITPKALQRLDRLGIIQAKRTATGRRYYTHEDVERYCTNKRF